VNAVTRRARGVFAASRRGRTARPVRARGVIPRWPAVAATVTVALTMLARSPAPALLGFIAEGAQRQGTPKDQPIRPHAEAITSALVPVVTLDRAPNRLRAAVSLLVMVVVALPVFTSGSASTTPARPASSTTRQAYDLLAKGFGPGFNGPFELVSALHGPADELRFAGVEAASHNQES